MTKYLILAIICLSVLSCSVRKKTKVQSASTTEMVSSFELSKIKLEQFGGSTYSIKDTSLKVAQRNIKDTLSSDAVKPVFDAQGKALPNRTYIKGSGVSVNLTALPSGQIAVDATCDSMELLVKGLITERDYYRAHLDSSNAQASVLKTSSSEHIESTKKSTQMPWWLWVLLTGAIVVVLIFIFLKQYKKGLNL